jgi:serine/threonine protein kinase
MLAQTAYRSPPLAVGNYEIISRAGAGVADVYRARATSGDLFAVYLFAEDAANKERLAARLRAEYDAVAALDHPNLLRVIDSGREGKFGYLVTEWVEGTTLARMIEMHTRLPEANVIRVLAQVGQALDHVRKGDQAVCRVGPGNVLIRSDGVAKLIPFSLPDQQVTPALGTASALLKPQFAAGLNADYPKTAVPFPELILSLGTTLHEALTGTVWVRPAPPEPNARKRSRSVQPRLAGLTDRTERAIRRATDADPAKRPESCAEFLKLLRPRSLTSGTKKTDTRTATATDNRRGCVRYALGVGSNCTINSNVFDPPEAPSDATELWPLVVQDVSATGIGLLLARRCEPGTELSVEVMTNPDRTPFCLPVRVVRVRKDNFGHWTHGCAFLTPLDEAELTALLGHLGRSDAV